MNRLITKLIIIIISISSLYSQKSTEILDSLSSKNKEYANITAEFSYQLSNENDETNENTDGILYIKNDMYRLDMSNELSIINNGETLWYFIKSIPEVQIMENDTEDPMNPSKIFTIYEEGYTHEYNNISLINGKEAYSITLYPKEEKDNLIKIIIMIDTSKMEIIQIESYHEDGSTRKYTINKFTPNGSISDDLFIFKSSEHPNVEIIDLR